eukprot:4584945-Pleurochrysis_carterae.AAC.1
MKVGNGGGGRRWLRRARVGETELVGGEPVGRRSGVDAVSSAKRDAAWWLSVGLRLEWGKTYGAFPALAETLWVCVRSQLCLSERTFTCEASGNVLELPVSRVAATASVVVRWNVLAADHWAAALPPPASVQLRVTHRNLSAHVYTCTTDASGRAELEQDAALFVGETYEIEAVGTPSLRGASVTFTVGKTPPHVVYLAVERPTQDVTIALAVT